MTDSLTIANRALLALGEERIDSFSEDSDTARAASEMYDYSRETVMVAHPWNFCGREADLAQDASPASSDYDFSFGLPSDFLRMRFVVGEQRSFRRFEILGRSLCISRTAVRIRYTWNAPINDAPAHVVSALVKLLASNLAGPIREEPALGERLYQAYLQEDLRSAKNIDSQQDFPNRVRDFPLITVRGLTPEFEGETL